jgi:peptide deformylase
LAIRNICLEGAPVLLETAAEVSSFDNALSALVRDMFETMYAAPGRGLAAPQVGVSSRIFVVDTDWKEADPAPMLFVNPRILRQSGDMVLGEEGCLSIPDKSFQVPRANWVELAWFDLEGAENNRRFAGIQARCICHELDHLNGVLITESGTLI